jgi:hypothetical protein
VPDYAITVGKAAKEQLQKYKLNLPFAPVGHKDNPVCTPVH